MNVIKKMHRREHLPKDIWYEVHRKYPQAIANAGIYCVTFFGHQQPDHVKETPESVFRGLVRQAIKEYQP